MDEPKGLAHQASPALTAGLNLAFVGGPRLLRQFAALDEYYRKAAMIGLPKDCAKAVLAEEVQVSMRSSGISFREAVWRATRRMIHG